MRKPSLPGVLLILLFSLAPACAPKPPNLTPAGQAAYTADQVAVRVNELLNATIAAESQGLLPTPQARTIIRFVAAAEPTLRAAPAGWAATLQTAWRGTKTQLPTITNPAIIAAMAAVDVVLGVL